MLPVVLAAASDHLQEQHVSLEEGAVHHSLLPEHACQAVPPSLALWRMSAARARPATHMCLSVLHDACTGGLLSSVSCVSGTAGLASEAERRERRSKDDRLAKALVDGGLQAFVSAWYEAPMWATLRAHPRFATLAGERAQQQGGDPAELAAVLSAASPGRQASLWPDLARLQPAILFVAGAEDAKFGALADAMAGRVAEAASADDVSPASMLRGRVAHVAGCGHAVHTERPEALVQVLGRFIYDAAGRSPAEV